MEMTAPVVVGWVRSCFEFYNFKEKQSIELILRFTVMKTFLGHFSVDIKSTNIIHHLDLFSYRFLKLNIFRRRFIFEEI